MSRRLVSEVDRQLQIMDGCRPVRDRGCVYVFVQRSGVGYVKIGTTIDLNQRSGDHQSNAFGELRLVAAFHGSYDLERALHERFARARIWGHREHFAQTRAVKRWLDDLTRLNGRDGLCWTCRATARELRERPPKAWTGFRLPAFRIEADKRDLRCGDACHPVHAWFDRQTNTFALGAPGTNGRCSTTPTLTAHALYTAESQEAWALNLWILACDSGRSIGSRHLAASLRGARNGGASFPMLDEDIALLRKAEIDVHHSAAQLFPDRQSFPGAPEVAPTAASERHLAASMRWLAEDFLVRYGVVQFCGCQSNVDVLRRLDRQINSGHDWRGGGCPVPFPETP